MATLEDKLVTLVRLQHLYVQIVSQRRPLYPWERPWASMTSSTDSRLEHALDEAEHFFMKTGKLHRAATELARRLDEARIPYAIVGALALSAHGYARMTADVDILLTRDGLARFKTAYLGRGYVETFTDSHGLRDTENDVRIDVLIAGEFPGDGLSKPVAFPDPADISVEGERWHIVPLPTLLELKLASGMTAAHRLKDLADVLEVIRAVPLPQTFADLLHPYVRDKYLELWRAAQTGRS